MVRVYGVELSFNNRAEVLKLPINPSEIKVSESGQGSSYDVAGLGQINVIKDRGLTEYSFSGLFPAQWYKFVATDDLLHPVEYIKMIEKWMIAKRPIRFIFTSDTYDINTPASIESFTWKEVAGSGGDIEYDIQLKKYVFYAAQKITRETTNGGGQVQKKTAKTRPNDKQQPKNYTMVAGDSLWKVAQTKLGNGALWKEIQKLNGIKDSDLKRLPVGKVLKLP
ncbi:MAG: LysM peptidoglycan-binding domain-containing protein [Paenibacillus macerans]|uniref:LysM domain protein n=1 Tax=Paenibacillus macerans TaxID=44252 RepID=A0A090Y970_PAEMA|nr:LysM peptidoglycan-binding domain-containing protein [Paenibacillus macerans]KFM94372.1 lysM domain protein [Paenibacillus macerans]MBS5909604.1 LysM peptidoglycan-binding domain-containing protein [Paenibacillus macerans]MCY7557268.1 LysM peptidoglycan-binding domain-containing protein [Paenibacillus macerans]MDU5946208.1 LysM peptidoglycan-binding domain-containing protein [Paenibacillus macerans]MDU7471807.1 LysM peptidoglycan-binding domain-containing protein [Paenibacillus macerans]